MNADELRTLQAPIKQRYRDDPQAARVCSRAEVILDPTGVQVALAPRAPVATLHRATGGTGEASCSADMLLEALAACAGVTLLAVATATGVVLAGGRVVAEGVWDARGTLGVDKTVPIGIQDITLTFQLDTTADPSMQQRLLSATERYCVILATLRATSEVAVTIRNAL
jgi:uncharacterized OsmC-like protein